MAIEVNLKDGTNLIFATPIVHHRLADAAAINAVLKDAILAEEKLHPGVQKSNVGGWHSDDGVLDWPHPEIDLLKRGIGEVVNRMLGRITGTKGATTALQVVAWANVLRDSHYNKIHHHPNCVLSGVYYVEVGASDPDRPESGLIEFLDPRFGVDLTEIPGSPFGGKYKVTPEPGSHAPVPVLALSLRQSLLRAGRADFPSPSM